MVALADSPPIPYDCAFLMEFGGQMIRQGFISSLSLVALMAVACESKSAAPPAPKAAAPTLDVGKVTARNKDVKPHSPRVALDAPATAALNAALTTYLGLKDALVTSDLAKVKVAYAPFSAAVTALKAVKPPEAADAAFRRQLAEVETGMQWVAEHDSTLPAFRRGFAAISDGMVALAASFQHSTLVYVQHCPMALDDGALWLSTSKDIRNPYYGDKMLECGEVQGTIPGA